MVHEEAEAASRVEAQVQSKLASRQRASKQKLQHLSDFAHALADGETKTAVYCRLMSSSWLQWSLCVTRCRQAVTSLTWGWFCRASYYCIEGPAASSVESSGLLLGLATVSASSPGLQTELREHIVAEREGRAELEVRRPEIA